MAVYLVVRTSEGSGRAPARCADWAQRTGTDVEVVGPLAVHDTRAWLGSLRYAGVVLELSRVRDDTTLAEAIARTTCPVVGVDRDGTATGPSVVGTACARTIAGRGTGGFVWALQHLHALREHPPRTLAYGDHDAHRGDLRVPDRTATAHPVVVLVHGGFWLHGWERDLMDGLALDLTRRGYATWNVEYRRLGPTAGGWPQSADDVARAVTGLTILADDPIDLDRLVLLGHSAGAQLALRATVDLRDRSRPPTLVVAMAGLFDLADAARRGVGAGAVQAFLGAGPDDDPARYLDAAPLAHLPLGVPQLLVHGTADRHVPDAQSRAHHQRAAAVGDDVRLVALPDADHFAVLDPTSDAWSTTVRVIEERVPVDDPAT